MDKVLLRGDIENGSLSRRPSRLQPRPRDSQDGDSDSDDEWYTGPASQQYRITMRKELMAKMKRHRIQKLLLPSAPLLAEPGEAEPGEMQRVVPNSAPGREREGRFRP